MNKRFRFTTSAIAALPANPLDAAGTELEFSDTEIVGLRILSDKTGIGLIVLAVFFLIAKPVITAKMEADKKIVNVVPLTLTSSN